MNADLAALIRLQDTRDGIAALTVRIEKEIPARVAELETELRAAEERFERERTIIETARRERSRLDLELKGAEEKINKYKAALMQVKNNDEYRAALNEIDYTQRTYADIEARILELMEAAESGQQELGALEDAMKSENQKIQTDRQTIEAECTQLTDERAALEKGAQAIEQEVPAPLLASFQRIVVTRRGQGLAAVGDGICLACNMRLRPAVYQQVKRNEQVTCCDSCRRILYYVPPADEEPSTEPSRPAATAVEKNATGNGAARAAGVAAATPEVAARPEAAQATSVGSTAGQDE